MKYRDVKNIDDDIFDLLCYIPGTLLEKQEFFMVKGIHVSRSAYWRMWESLKSKFSNVEATELVFKLLMSREPDNLKQLIQRKVKNERVQVPNDEDDLIDSLFFSNGNLRKIGKLYLNFRREAKVEYTNKSNTKISLVEQDSTKYKHDVAISYAGEDREIAVKLANALTEKGLKVFYDKYYEGDMWGKKLSPLLREAYGASTRYVVLIISKHYPNKDSTNFEFNIAKEEAKKREGEFILPVAIDDTILVGLHSDVMRLDYYKYGVNKIVELLIQKITGKKPIKIIEKENELLSQFLDDDKKVLGLLFSMLEEGKIGTFKTSSLMHLFNELDGISTEDFDSSIAILESQGIIEILSVDRFKLTLFGYQKYASHFTSIRPDDDIRDVFLCFNDPEIIMEVDTQQGRSGPKIQQKTRLSILQINYAIRILAEKKYLAPSYGAHGQKPFEFHHVKVTAIGRRKLKQINESK